jgi:transposase
MKSKVYSSNTNSACRPNVQMSVLSNLKMSVSAAFWRAVGATSVAVLSMSDGELRRLEVLRDVNRGGLPVSAAAQLLGRSERQVRRLLKAFRSDGAAGLISKKRGRPSNRKTAAAMRAAALRIVRQNYADFGPTLAAEKLAGEHGFSFSSETLRKWIIADGLWLDRKQRQRRIHQPRSRRDCVGELVQVDGSEHWWFEDRGPQCTLLVFVDDATSRLMHLQFVESESTFAYFDAARLCGDLGQADRLL